MPICRGSVTNWDAAHESTPDKTDASPRRRKQKLTRAQKVASNRQALFRAGAEVVGERGYEEASVARIIERAGLAHGTFYKHFELRQAMFDELLPSTGQDLLDEVRELVRGSKDILEVEEKGFRAFFDFLVKHPAPRLVNEAEVTAPSLRRTHQQSRTTLYQGIEVKPKPRGNPGL